MEPRAAAELARKGLTVILPGEMNQETLAVRSGIPVVYGREEVKQSLGVVAEQFEVREARRGCARVALSPQPAPGRGRG
jgi:hypothetical protein